MTIRTFLKAAIGLGTKLAILGLIFRGAENLHLQLTFMGAVDAQNL